MQRGRGIWKHPRVTFAPASKPDCENCSWSCVSPYGGGASSGGRSGTSAAKPSDTSGDWTSKLYRGGCAESGTAPGGLRP